MAFSSQVYPKELIINDSTPVGAALPPHGQARGLIMDLRPPEGYQGIADSFPSDLIIPRSEWEARIKEKEERKTRGSDMALAANLPCKDQDSTNYSHDCLTEVLTNKGWVRWPDYNGSDLLGTVNNFTGAMEFQAPTECHAYEYDDEMYHSTNNRLDFGVTRNHRMLVRKWDERRRTLSNEYSFQRADSLGWYVGLMHAPHGWLGTELVEVEVPGDRRYDGDDFLAMISVIVSDGYAGGSESTKNLVSFCCFHEDRYQKVAALAQRIGFKENPGRRGVWTRYDASALAQWIRQECYQHGSPIRSPHKKIPDIVRCASQRQIRVFLDFFGDQSHSGQSGFYSTSKRIIDDLQELLLRVGKRGTIWKPQSIKQSVLEDGTVISPNYPLWSLGSSRTDRLCLDRKKHIETDHYKGTVYCATVPNGTLITRRNGSILISGNCWINAPTYCVEQVRMIQNQEMVILSPASVGGPMTGFKNVGGWGGPGLQYIIEHGLVPVSKWPANAIKREYWTEENKALALHYRATEWWELKPRNVEQLITCLLLNLPVAVGYNWWSHEVTAVDAVWLDGTAAIRIRNSWSMTWGEKGFGILQGSKMLPDDAVVPRQALAA